MNSRNLPNDQPFWQDELSPSFDLKPLKPFVTGFSLVIKLAIFIPMIVTVALLFYLISPQLFWIWGAIVLISLGLGYYNRRKNDLITNRIAEIQQRAKEFTRASYIGSAIHVAGHPLLEREQPVVLALVHGQELCIYCYDSSKSITSIPVEDMKSIQTVVYDDERIPHVEVIDSTAQALQIIFEHESKEFVVLFRSMKKIRPIDWYQILQKSRISLVD